MNKKQEAARSQMFTLRVWVEDVLNIAAQSNIFSAAKPIISAIGKP